LDIWPIRCKVPPVNSYLVRGDSGFVLIDTGFRSGLRHLEAVLAGAGCLPGQLRLIVITHGDFDHSANAAYLRSKYGAPIAMHAADAPMVELGDMFAGRSRSNPLVRGLANALFRITTFAPDQLLEDGQSLRPNGLDATVLSLPGHSKGSIGVLTADGCLFCGDLIDSSGPRPRLTSLLDDAREAGDSLDRLTQLGVKQVYPGHGRPFAMSEVTGPRGS